MELLLFLLCGHRKKINLAIWQPVNVLRLGVSYTPPVCEFSFHPLHQLLPQTSHNFIVYLYSWVGQIPSLDWPWLFRLDKIMMVFQWCWDCAEKEVTSLGTFWQVFVCVIVCMNDEGIYCGKHFFNQMMHVSNLWFMNICLHLIITIAFHTELTSSVNYLNIESKLFFHLIYRYHY